MKVFLDVDGVLIHGWHAKPEFRRPWDATIEQDLGISREEFQRKCFGTPTPGYNCIMHACVGGDLDLKEALSGILPSLGYEDTVDRVVEYWFTNDSVINADVIGAVACLAKLSHVELYLATGQEHYQANYL